MGSEAICHCLLLETSTAGLILVDTGIGHRVTQAPSQRVSFANRLTVRPRFVLEESALSHVHRLGYQATDVQHILVTHLDFDHAGGLQDFPEATVHVFGPELDTAQNQRDPRYDRRLWQHNPRWQRYDVAGDTWFGFQRVRPLAGLSEDIALIPLVGHTTGHCGIAVRTAQHWLLHAGDCYLNPSEVLTNPSAEASPTRLFTRVSSWLTTMDPVQQRHNVKRLRELSHSHGREVKVFSAHSITEFGRLAAAQAQAIQACRPTPGNFA